MARMQPNRRAVAAPAAVTGTAPATAAAAAAVAGAPLAAAVAVAAAAVVRPPSPAAVAAPAAVASVAFWSMTCGRCTQAQAGAGKQTEVFLCFFFSTSILEFEGILRLVRACTVTPYWHIQPQGIGWQSAAEWQQMASPVGTSAIVTREWSRDSAPTQQQRVCAGCVGRCVGGCCVLTLAVYSAAAHLLRALCAGPRLQCTG